MAVLAPEGSQFDTRWFDAKIEELLGTDEEFFTSYDEVCDSFDAMGIQENLLRGIYGCGFENPSAKEFDVVQQVRLGEEKHPSPRWTRPVQKKEQVRPATHI